ncbi:hypothetical protein GCM10009677_17680 [Sphaerisporangium rubeum]
MDLQVLAGELGRPWSSPVETDIIRVNRLIPIPVDKQIEKALDSTYVHVRAATVGPQPPSVIYWTNIMRTVVFGRDQF